jgi:hypothetical protein
VIAIFVILVVWIGVLALVLGALHIGTGTRPPRPAPRPFLTSNTVELDLSRRRAA